MSNQVFNINNAANVAVGNNNAVRQLAGQILAWSNASYVPHPATRTILFYPALVPIGAGVTGALFLSYAIRASAEALPAGGWFAITGEEWQHHTGLTRSEQKSARRRLREIGVLHEVRKGQPAQLHYKVDWDKLKQLLTERHAANGEKQGAV